MGSSSSASTSQSSTQNVDKRQVVDGGSVGVTADNSKITLNSSSTDQGSVKAAFDFAKFADATNGDGFSKLLDTANNIFTSSLTAVSQSNQTLSDAYKTAQTEQNAKATLDSRYLVAAGLAVVAIVGLRAVKL